MTNLPLLIILSYLTSGRMADGLRQCSVVRDA